MQFKNSYPLYFWSFLSQAILFSVLHFLFLFSFFFLFLNLSNKSGIFFLLLFFFCLFLYSFCLLEVFYEILKLGTNSSSNCFWFVSFPHAIYATFLWTHFKITSFLCHHCIVGSWSVCTLWQVLHLLVQWWLRPHPDYIVFMYLILPWQV